MIIFYLITWLDYGLQKKKKLSTLIIVEIAYRRVSTNCSSFLSKVNLIIKSAVWFSSLRIYRRIQLFSWDWIRCILLIKADCEVFETLSWITLIVSKLSDWITILSWPLCWMNFSLHDFPWKIKRFRFFHRSQANSPKKHAQLVTLLWDLELSCKLRDNHLCKVLEKKN